MTSSRTTVRIVAAMLCGTFGLAAAQGGNADLAQTLSNPLAALISVPFQLNFDRGLGPTGDGERWQLNVQPVVPIALDDRWNLISRTIVPVIRQDLGAGSGRPDVDRSPKDP